MLLDAGNVFASGDLLGRLKGQVILEAMGDMSYDGLNLGGNEFLFGTSFILDTAAQFGLPLISANVVYEDNGTTIAAASRVLSAGDVRVGVAGIVSRNSADDILNSGDLQVMEEATALQAEVDRIRDTTELIVVMANTGLDAAKALAESVSDIDVIIAGRGTDETAMYLKINGVYIVKAGYAGRNIGRLDLVLDGQKNILSASGEIVGLDQTVPEDDGILALLEAFHESLKDYRDELFDIEQKEPAEGGNYAGMEACIACHAGPYEQWRSTDHAKAIDSLEQSGQDYNPECVYCHVNGFGFTGGFERPDSSPEKANVQCEMCHGAGGKHLEDTGEPYGEISRLTCVVCHTGDKSPGFDYETYYQLVKH